MLCHIIPFLLKHLKTILISLCNESLDLFIYEKSELFFEKFSTETENTITYIFKYDRFLNSENLFFQLSKFILNMKNIFKLFFKLLHYKLELCFRNGKHKSQN